MSRRRHATYSCHRKTSHPSRKAAVAVRDALQAKDGVELSVYRCEWCSGWHICKRENHQGKREGNRGKQ